MIAGFRSLASHWDVLLLVALSLLFFGLLAYVLNPGPRLTVHIRNGTFRSLPLPESARITLFESSPAVRAAHLPLPVKRTLPLTTPSPSPVNINRAEAGDLDRLPGIGPTLARRIIDYRQRHGPFRQAEDLLNVSGIGPKNLQKLRPYLIIR